MTKAICCLLLVVASHILSIQAAEQTTIHSDNIISEICTNDLQNQEQSKNVLQPVASKNLLKLNNITFHNQPLIPRFVSTKSNEVNARSGPNLKSAVEWVFIRKNEPVEVIAEYEQWRKVRDIKGEGGWVHASVLSGKRFIVVISGDITPIFSTSHVNSKILAKVAPNVRCQLDKCNIEWCKVKCKEHKGWIKRNLLWGVYDNEKVS